jgi:YD repeat-containing protein
VEIADERITTTYAYNAVGQLITTTNALSGTTVTHYDARGQAKKKVTQLTKIGLQGLVVNYWLFLLHSPKS